MRPMENEISIKAQFVNHGSALLAVDIQNDFLPGGSLEVPDGDRVIPPLNKYLEAFRLRQLPVFATRDWHPANHCSFKERGGPWPPHCVANTDGAKFAQDLDLPSDTIIISKAVDPEVEVYSAFQGTDLDEHLKRKGITRLFIGGLATEYCVLYTVRDALQLGYNICILKDTVRGINATPGDEEKAFREMKKSGIVMYEFEDIFPALPKPGALLTDHYQLAMLKGYFDREMEETAVFEFFVRRFPQERGYMIAAGLEQTLEYLENLRFTSPDLDWLASAGNFDEKFLSKLEAFKFTGNVDAMKEGTVFFPDEPILRITAPLPQAQLIETRIINLLQYQSLVATKAARMVRAAPEKVLMDFSLRRAHGSEAGILAARASYLAGFAGAANVLAGAVFGIPVFGTMAHSFIQAHDDEIQAFENFAKSWPNDIVLLLDTYETETAAEKVVLLAKRLQKEGVEVRGVRLDSGDLKVLSRKVREIFDREGLENIRIFASGNIDEFAITELLRDDAPIDGFGVGTRLAVSEDVPSLDCVYKLQEYAGKPRRKRSQGKATWPGRKQVYRQLADNGTLKQDILALEGEPCEGELLLKPLMRNGRRLGPPTPIEDIRKHVREEMERLPENLQALKCVTRYPVHISKGLQQMKEELDAG